MLQKAVYGTQGLLDMQLRDEAERGNGSTAAISALLAQGAQLESTDMRGETALHHSLQHGTAEVQQFLLDAGANTGARSFMGLTPLMFAARRNLAATARILDVNAAVDDITPAAETALMMAVDAGKIDVAQALFKAGADPAKADGYGRSALHRALQQNQPALLVLFMPEVEARLAFIKANDISYAAAGQGVQTGRSFKPLKPLRFGNKGGAAFA